MIQSSISTEVSTEVCEEFKKSIICTLSLSSKELFHSNMIGWLIENNLDFARNILERPDLNTERKVEREKYNFDLLVTANGEKFVIENKVKSLPDYQQLEGYRRKMVDKKELKVQYILISLIAPGVEFKKEDSFIRVISYEDIRKWILESELGDPYLKVLIQDYGKLIDTLIHVKEVAAHINDDKELSFSKSNEMILREIRLFDVAQKIRYSRFEALCHSRLEGINLRDRLNIRVGFSMSMGRIDIEALFPAKSHTKPLLLGIEIQNDQYRLFVASQNGWNVANLANVLKENNLWLTSPNGNCGKILKFGEEFKYSYFSIKGETVGNLLKHIEEDIGRILTNLNEIEEVIKEVIGKQP
jgi:hypothetical protein